MYSIRNTSLFLASILVLSAQVSSTFALDTEATPEFSYQTFTTCSELESTFKAILPTTYSDGRFYRGGPIMALQEGTANAIAPMATDKAVSSPVPKSDTNVQVKGIDEADTVKTDGKYIYSFQESDHTIVILDAGTLAKVKTLRIPSNYSGVSFYVTKNKLILTATRYVQPQNYWTYWYNNSQKSVITLYDIRDPARASIVRSIEVDGNLSDSRLGDTGIMTAIVETSYWMPPIYRNYWSDTTKIQKPVFDYSPKNLIPQISDQQFASGKQTSKNRALGDCSGMSSILPKANTLSKYSFNPTLTSILRFDTSIPDGQITSQIVLTDAGQIHVTRDSIYLTANMWTPRVYSPCPINARCMNPMIWNQSSSSTLVHRFAVTNTNIRYRYSRIVSGTPLTQYSMDEDDSDNFRIITSLSSWSGGTNTSTTKLSVLNSSGTIIGSLSGIAPGESFQSSRFIGNRLYLVTFEQIDPLFVIDLTTPTAPKILGELKMPGYSTYLHPYDANRLIGIGYDTITNKWGGTQNSGIKIDLYNVSDIRNPVREGTLTLGDAGSSSDALWNPKAFVWYKEKNILLLPATLMTSAKDPENSYLSAKAFQGLVAVGITPGSIVEKFRITHMAPPATIEATWKKDCATYEKNTTGYKQYIPEYCKVGATLDMYMASMIWNYSRDFITRVLYVGDNIYTIGTSKIQLQTFDAPNTVRAYQAFKNNIKYGYEVLGSIMNFVR